MPHLPNMKQCECSLTFIVELNQYSEGYRWDIMTFCIKKSGSGKIYIFVRMLQGAATMLCFESGNHGMHWRVMHALEGHACIRGSCMH